MKRFFENTIRDTDPDIHASLERELERQRNTLELIASENIVSKAVLDAISNVLTNKYAEGYPNKRYYGGCEFADEVEEMAIERAKLLFNCEYANVQPHSGSQANQAVFFSLLNPGDTILGMSLNEGGHLTHGAAPNLSGRWFNAVQYGVNPDTGFIDYDKFAAVAKEHKPKLIIVGASAYPRKIDFKRSREISDSVGAYLLADIAHYAGLITSGFYPSPIDFADIVTTTTHKTLRGPRGGMILSNNQELFKKLNSAIFPGIQGGPLMNIIAAKAVSFKEALLPEFKVYSKSVIENAQALGAAITARGYKLVTGGTDCHLILVDLKDKNFTGKDADASLDRAGITCNKNTVPGEMRSPFITSGIRLGSPALTSRGLNTKDFEYIGNLISDIFDGLERGSDNSSVEQEVKGRVQDLCKKYPIY
ncbi:MAG: serine hydroxymethyltransferase [Rickettsiales bacterium]|nr:serine hydroxymethyltransferase [Rickettsiales bacterium]